MIMIGTHAVNPTAGRCDFRVGTSKFVRGPNDGGRGQMGL